VAFVEHGDMIYYASIGDGFKKGPEGDCESDMKAGSLLIHACQTGRSRQQETL